MSESTPPRLPKKPPELVATWFRWFAIPARRMEGVKVSPDTLMLLGGWCALNTCTTLIMTRLVADLQDFFLRGSRHVKIPRFLEVMPADPKTVTQFMLTLQAYCRLHPIGNHTFHPEVIGPVMGGIEDPHKYFEAARTSKFETGSIGATFHPNTYKAISSRYRGVFSPLAQTEYRKTFTQRIVVVE